MEGNKALLDAHAVLRFLLRDNEEQFIYIRKMVRTKSCYVTLEVMAEVCYVFRRALPGFQGGYYKLFFRFENGSGIAGKTVYFVHSGYAISGTYTTDKKETRR